MVENIAKILEFLSDNKKYFLVPATVSFPLVYTCLFFCMENFSGYFMFDRVVIAVSVVIIQMLLFQVVYLVGFDPENPYIFALTEKDTKKLKGEGNKNEIYIDAFIRVNNTLSIGFSLLYAGSAIIAMILERHLNCIYAYHLIVNPAAYALFFSTFIISACVVLYVRKKRRIKRKRRKSVPKIKKIS